MNKIVLTSVAAICTTIICAACHFVNSNERVKMEQINSNERVKMEQINSNERVKITLKTETRDRFTVCIDTVMTKSIEAGKPISANEAKNVCTQVEKV